MHWEWHWRGMTQGSMQHLLCPMFITCSHCQYQMSQAESIITVRRHNNNKESNWWQTFLKPSLPGQLKMDRYIVYYELCEVMVIVKSLWWLLMPGTSLVPGHQQPSWWHRAVSTCKGSPRVTFCLGVYYLQALLVSNVWGGFLDCTTWRILLFTIKGISLKVAPWSTQQ